MRFLPFNRLPVELQGSENDQNRTKDIFSAKQRENGIGIDVRQTQTHLKVLGDTDESQSQPADLESQDSDVARPPPLQKAVLRAKGDDIPSALSTGLSRKPTLGIHSLVLLGELPRQLKNTSLVAVRLG